MMAPSIQEGEVVRTEAVRVIHNKRASMLDRRQMRASIGPFLCRFPTMKTLNCAAGAPKLRVPPSSLPALP